MKSARKFIDAYSRFVSHNPYIMIIIVILISGIAIFGAKKIEMRSMDYKDMLPDDNEVINTMNRINDEFGGTESGMIVIEIDPNYAESDEPRDIRDPDVIQYIYLLTESARYIDDVIRVTSAASILKDENDNHLPKSKKRIIELIDDNQALENYISEDNQLTVIRISLSDSYNEDDLIVDMGKLIREIERPSGLKVNIAGDSLSGAIIKQMLGSDMQKTSRMSILGIIFILILLFRSIRFSMTPLATIGIGLLWAFGFIGFIGMGLTSATSGVISMIMGIGIDFGIQTVTRYRYELKETGPRRAMNATLNAVFVPMSTTTLAALIGFRAMSLGELTMMAEMGTIMSYGITACFFAAITVVPAVLVISERLLKKN